MTTDGDNEAARGAKWSLEDLARIAARGHYPALEINRIGSTPGAEYLAEMRRRHEAIPRNMTVKGYFEACADVMFQVAAEALACRQRDVK